MSYEIPPGAVGPDTTVAAANSEADALNGTRERQSREALASGTRQFHLDYDNDERTFDGRVTPTEFAEAMRAENPDMTDEQILGVFNRYDGMDGSNDGFLRTGEFSQALQELRNFLA